MASRSSPSVSTASNDYVILPPTTTGDDGTPSNSICQDLDRIVRLIQDERHITAHNLLQSVKEKLKLPPVLPETPKKGILKRKPKISTEMLTRERDYYEAKAIIENSKDILEKLEVRRSECC